MNTTGYKCPCCGAPLEFDSVSQQMKCDACGNKFKTEDVENFARENERAERDSSFEWAEYKGEQVKDTVVFTCSSCGGEIIGDENTAATKCPYCDNVAIMEGRLSGTLKPDFVIPFKLTREDAKAALLNFYKGKKLLPDAFKDANKLEEIFGIYVPFWLFDCDADGSVTYNAQRVRSWRAGKYQVTRTEHFALVREGEMSFERIPVDASTKMDDSFMDAVEPFDYGEAVSFNTAYLSGFLADKYDVTDKDSLPRANERVTQSIIDALRGTVHGYSAVTVRNSNVMSKNGATKYALLPLWMLRTEYKGETYVFAMNGQTGKIVGNLPVDWGKYWKKLFLTALAIALPIAAVILLAGGGVI